MNVPSGLFDRAWSTYPGMAVRTRISNHEGRTWVLRWESLPANRDAARSEMPPPCELHLYEMKDNTK